MSNDKNRQRKLRGVYELLEGLCVPKKPTWKVDPEIPSTDIMLKEIVDYKNLNLQNTRNNQQKLDELKEKFVLSSNIGENEGTQTIDSTRLALKEKDSENISKEDQVSINLMAALNHLEERNCGEDKGLIDVEECIQDTHKTLMKNLLPKDKYGEFSTNVRMAADDGHEYPKFETKEEAYNAVQRILDDYNATVDYIKSSDISSLERNSMYIRCAAYILYNFVDLHPFSDGNGRMCRLLASRCLYLVFPFPCPIYNIYAPTNRDDYINAIKKARRHNGKHLGDLVALLIESGWHTAKHVMGSD